MIARTLGYGCAALSVLAAVACAGGSAATTTAPRAAVSTAPRAAAAVPRTTPARAPAASQTCGPQPARRAWAQEISASGTVLWQKRLPTDPVTPGIALQPLVFGGTGVFAEENVLYGLRLSDGHQLWRKVFPAAVTGAMAQFSGMVYGLWAWHGSVIVLVGQVTNAARLLSLNPATGAVHWTLPLHGGLLGSQALTGDGGLAMIRGFATLMVVNLANGHVRWTRTAGHVAPPAVAGGVVVAAVPAGNPNSHGAVMGFDARTGKLLWTRRDMPEQPTLAVADGHAVVYDGSQDVYPPVPLWPVTALSPATGRTLWRTAIAEPVYMVSAGPSGLAVTTFGKSRLYLINQVTGRVRWGIPYRGSQPPSDTGTGLLYTGRVPGAKGLSLVDLRPASGSARWTVPAPATAFGPVVRFGPYALVTGFPARPGDPGVLAAFRLSTGQRAWTAAVPTTVLVPSAVAGDRLLVQPTDPGVACAAAGNGTVVSGVGTAG